MDTILSSIKILLGLPIEDSNFDQELIMNINSVLMVLNQIGYKEFYIAGDTETWEDYIGTTKSIESIKMYIFLYVKLVFDPPTTSFVIESINRTMKELEWRLFQDIERSTNAT